MLSSSSMAAGEGCTLEDEPPVVLLDFVMVKTSEPS